MSCDDFRLSESYDREFNVIVNPDSTTAEKGRDYEGLTDIYVIKAGENGMLLLN